MLNSFFTLVKMIQSRESQTRISSRTFTMAKTFNDEFYCPGKMWYDYLKEKGVH